MTPNPDYVSAPFEAGIINELGVFRQAGEKLWQKLEDGSEVEVTDPAVLSRTLLTRPAKFPPRKGYGLIVPPW